MKKLGLLLLFFGVFAFAQNTRIIYEYYLKQDSLKQDDIKKELMYLDITKSGSKFYSRDKAIQDSTINAEMQKRRAAAGGGSFSFSAGTMKPAYVSYKVTKSYPDFKTVLHTGIGRDSYAISETESINWKIVSESKTIGEFKAQKATADFGGRKWIAWFTPDIPFQDGPYKFSGLPGLILELEDTKQQHVFKFAGSKNFSEVNLVSDSSVKSGNGMFIIGAGSEKEIDVTKQKFNQLWNEYKNDPVKDMRQMIGRPGMQFRVNINGKEITDPAEMLRTQEKAAKDRLKQDNNQIELSLYK